MSEPIVDRGSAEDRGPAGYLDRAGYGTAFGWLSGLALLACLNLWPDFQKADVWSGDLWTAFLVLGWLATAGVAGMSFVSLGGVVMRRPRPPLGALTGARSGGLGLAVGGLLGLRSFVALTEANRAGEFDLAVLLALILAIAAGVGGWVAWVLGGLIARGGWGRGVLPAVGTASVVVLSLLFIPGLDAYVPLVLVLGTSGAVAGAVTESRWGRPFRSPLAIGATVVLAICLGTFAPGFYPREFRLGSKYFHAKIVAYRIHLYQSQNR